MIEVPAAAISAADFASRLDFLSIRTNDLIQYTLAIDRLDNEVTYLYDPLHPSILQLIKIVIEAGKTARIPVAMCGEMAGDPLATLLLVGMGLEEFSMESLFIPVVKKVIRSMSYQTAKNSAQIVLDMDTVGEIKGYFFSQMRNLGMVELLELYS